MVMIVNPSTKRVVPIFRPWKKLTAVVVDNDRICHTVQEVYLKYFGFHTHVVNDGRDAVNLLATPTAPPFDLIIIDKMLPSLNGVEVVRLIRGTGITCKIIGYYGAYDDRVRDEFIEAGANEFYVKPLRTGDLTGIIRELYKEG